MTHRKAQCQIQGNNHTSNFYGVFHMRACEYTFMAREKQQKRVQKQKLSIMLK